MANQPKQKRYRLYEFFNGSGANDLKANPNAPRDLKYFFGLLKRRFGMLITVNFMLVFGNFPVLFAFFALAGFLDDVIMGPTSTAFAQLHGILTAGEPVTPGIAALLGVYGVQGEISIPTTWTYVFYGIALVGTLLTFGLVNTGTAHILRSMVRESPIFLWSDFIDTIKKNLKQALILGALDLSISLALVYNFFFYLLNGGQTVINLFFYLNIVFAFFYFIMRFYLYQMMITFDLSIRKLFKNALLFVMVGLKRNILGILGILLVIALNYILLMIYYPIGLMMPFLITFSACAFISAYAAYPKIKEIMIDPYVAKKKQTAPAVAEESAEGADADADADEDEAEEESEKPEETETEEA